MLHADDTLQARTERLGLEFLWLELTNQCNLQCVHCYAESGPRTGICDALATKDYINLLNEAWEIGCRSVQFIGGEPTLNRALGSLISHAHQTGFEFVEVFTNLTTLSDQLITLFKQSRVQVATSIYSNVEQNHDRITTVPGSFAKTISNIQKLISADIPVRACLVAIDENSELQEETKDFLRALGIRSISSDRVRKVGRGASSTQSDMSELCGQCAMAKLCVGSDGLVAPCIMSKAWSVGSVLDTSLADIVRSDALLKTRSRIAEATRGVTDVACNPERPYPCGPDRGGPCNPCNPNTHCGPNSCMPVRKMYAD